MSGADFAQQANIAQQAHKAGGKGSAIDIESAFGRGGDGAKTIMHGGTPDYIANAQQQAAGGSGGGGGDSGGAASSGGSSGGTSGSEAMGASLASAGVTAQSMANAGPSGGGGFVSQLANRSVGDDGGRGM